jgi:hypothetical protein
MEDDEELGREAKELDDDSKRYERREERDGEREREREREREERERKERSGREEREKRYPLLSFSPFPSVAISNYDKKPKKTDSKPKEQEAEDI